MKLLPLLLLYVIPCTAQNTTAKLVDSTTYNFLSPVIKMIQVAEDPKKGPGLLMTDLQETNFYGEAVYMAPYAINKFKATIRKTKTDRTAKTTTWEWKADFTKPFENSTPINRNNIQQKADSLLQLLKYSTGETINHISYIYTYITTYDNPAMASVVMVFSKVLYNTEQQAYDSLLALYKPLLSTPAFAADAAQKLGYALRVEGFDKNKITNTFEQLLTDVANNNSEAAYQVLLGVPDFIDYKALNAKLPATKQSDIRAWAAKDMDKFYEQERKKVEGEPVAAQQKQMQTKKNGCNFEDMNMFTRAIYQLGITVTGTVNYQPFVGRVTAIDCATRKVTITKPGDKRLQKDEVIQVPEYNYVTWSKNRQQFHRCSRCGGEGGELVTTTSSRTKELPFGYFSGIETKVTRTTTKTSWENCYTCGGTGWMLQ